MYFFSYTNATAAITITCPYSGSAEVTLPKKWKNKRCDWTRETYLYSAKKFIYPSSVRSETLSDCLVSILNNFVCERCGAKGNQTTIKMAVQAVKETELSTFFDRDYSRCSITKWDRRYVLK
jgi:hypothetical protein